MQRTGKPKDPPPAPLNLSKHLPHPPWQILWRVGLKSRPCIIHECWWISISDTTLTYCWEHLCLHAILHREMREHMVTVKKSHVHNCFSIRNHADTITLFLCLLHQDIRNGAHIQFEIGICRKYIRDFK